MQGKYAVTIYQLGWRLGGKGASGRGPADRIEEHGLHLWMGFYENAFRLMRECYAELGRDPATCRIADWRDAFFPDHFCGAMDHAPDGRWIPWAVHFPPADGLPGDPPSRSRALDRHRLPATVRDLAADRTASGTHRGPAAPRPPSAVPTPTLAA